MKKMFSFAVVLFLVVVTYKNGVVEKYNGDLWKQEGNMVVIYKTVKSDAIFGTYGKPIVGIDADLIKKIEIVEE